MPHTQVAHAACHAHSPPPHPPLPHTHTTLTAAPAALLLLCYKIVTFQRWSDEYPYVLRFVACIGLMIVELLWENVMVWWAGCPAALPVRRWGMAGVQQTAAAAPRAHVAGTRAAGTCGGGLSGCPRPQAPTQSATLRPLAGLCLPRTHESMMTRQACR